MKSSCSNPAQDDIKNWRAKFIHYYETNAPSKVKFVTEDMMNKYHGKYEELYINLEKKYGPLGSPLQPEVSAVPVVVAGGGGGSKANGIGAFRSFFGKWSDDVDEQIRLIRTDYEHLKLSPMFLELSLSLLSRFLTSLPVRASRTRLTSLPLL